MRSTNVLERRAFMKLATKYYPRFIILKHASNPTDVVSMLEALGYSSYINFEWFELGNCKERGELTASYR